MEHFDLSYKTLEDREISLVVERLPLDLPEFQAAWQAIAERPDSHEIAMRFELSTVPAGIPTWFIARSHRFTTHTHWRGGALFADGAERRHLALVRAFAHDRYVELVVRGPNPHNFLALMKDGLELTLARFPGLGIDRKIPCPGHDGEPCTFEFDYERILKAVHKRPTVECHETFEDVSVTRLLFGLHWSTQDVVLSKLDELRTEIVENRDLLIDLRALTQREFTKLFRSEQSNIDTHCPNVFVVRPRGSVGLREALVGRRLELRLYCQAPGHWHPTVEGGRYEIDEPAEWLAAVGPYVRRLVDVFQHVAPLVGPVLGVALPDFSAAIKNDLVLMNELVKLLPDVVHGGRLHVHVEEPGRVEGAALRAVRELLEAKDPSRHWGGLRKILSPEGHYLWLCDEHAAEYAL